MNMSSFTSETNELRGVCSPYEGDRVISLSKKKNKKKKTLQYQNQTHPNFVEDYRQNGSIGNREMKIQYGASVSDELSSFN